MNLKKLLLGEEFDVDRFTELTESYDKLGNKIHVRLNELTDEEPQFSVKAITYVPSDTDTGAESSSGASESSTDTSQDD